METKLVIRLLAAVIIGLGVFGIVRCSSNNKGVPDVTSSDEKQKLLKDFKVNDVAEVKIIEKNETATITKGAESWVLAERDNYPVDIKKVSDLIRIVWKMDKGQIIPLQENQYARVDLLDPALPTTKEKDAATILEMRDKDKNLLAKLWLGKIHEAADAAANSPYSSGLTDVGRYIKTGDSAVVYVVKETFRDTKAKGNFWLNKDFFAVSDIKTISRTTAAKPEDNWSLSREKSSDDLTLEGIKEGEELGDMNPYAGAFGNPSFDDVVVGEAAKTPEDVVFNITTFDGFTYEIACSEKNDLNECNVAIKVSGEFPETREVPEGTEESEEDKKAADEKFAKDIEARKAKLAEQKKFEGRIFKMRSYLVDKFNKPRADLLKGEDDPAAGAQPPGL